jgi:hypothetical protein
MVTINSTIMNGKKILDSQKKGKKIKRDNTMMGTTEDD